MVSIDIKAENERLRNDNTSLVAAYREKSRKHQQTQELYDRLKRKEMTAATQSAAFESVDDVLGAIANRRGAGPPLASQPQEQPRFQPFDPNFNSTRPSDIHQRRESFHSQNSGGVMPPPPVRRPNVPEMKELNGGKSNLPMII